MLILNEPSYFKTETSNGGDWAVLLKLACWKSVHKELVYKRVTLQTGLSTFKSVSPFLA